MAKYKFHCSGHHNGRQEVTFASDLNTTPTITRVFGDELSLWQPQPAPQPAPQPQPTTLAATVGPASVSDSGQRYYILPAELVDSVSRTPHWPARAVQERIFGWLQRQDVARAAAQFSAGEEGQREELLAFYRQLVISVSATQKVPHPLRTRICQRFDGADGTGGCFCSGGQLEHCGVRSGGGVSAGPAGLGTLPLTRLRAPAHTVPGAAVGGGEGG